MSTQTLQKSPPGWITRRAKLFEAGEYPDKGVTVTADHLSGLAATFSDPVPLLIEHAESPLQMGFLTGVFSEGAELFGTVSLTPEADALVEKSGARSLSLGLAPDLSSIREVSLVRNPRIESARLFGGDVQFEGMIDDGDDGDDFSFSSPSIPSIPSSPSPATTNLEREWTRLREAKVDQQLDELVRGGRLCPAQVQFAKALLMAEDTIEFDGETKPVRQLVLALLERQPKSTLFSEIAPAPVDHSEHLVMPEEAEFYRRHFPEVSLAEIAKRRR